MSRAWTCSSRLTELAFPRQASTFWRTSRRFPMSLQRKVSSHGGATAGRTAAIAEGVHNLSPPPTLSLLPMGLQQLALCPAQGIYKASFECH